MQQEWGQVNAAMNCMHDSNMLLLKGIERQTTAVACTLASIVIT